MNYLWPILQGEIESRYFTWRGERDEIIVTDSATRERDIQLHRVPLEWSPPQLPPDIACTAEEGPGAEPQQESTVSDLVWRAGQSARAAGVVVHAMLHRLATEGKEFWLKASQKQREALLLALFMDTGVPDPNSEAVSRAAEAVDRILSDERGCWLLDRHEHAECELSLSGFDGDAIIGVRIDRTFVTADNVRWIVDYKTATHEGADLEEFLGGQEKLYRPRLERYARMMNAWDGRPVRAALYYPLLQRWREVSLQSGEN